MNLYMKNNSQFIYYYYLFIEDIEDMIYSVYSPIFLQNSPKNEHQHFIKECKFFANAVTQAAGKKPKRPPIVTRSSSASDIYRSVNNNNNNATNSPLSTFSGTASLRIKDKGITVSRTEYVDEAESKLEKKKEINESDRKVVSDLNTISISPPKTPEEVDLRKKRCNNTTTNNTTKLPHSSK